jgi:hypothetical protein
MKLEEESTMPMCFAIQFTNLSSVYFQKY